MGQYLSQERDRGWGGGLYILVVNIFYDLWAGAVSMGVWEELPRGLSFLC